jgi:hypothetical protein
MENADYKRDGGERVITVLMRCVQVEYVLSKMPGTRRVSDFRFWNISIYI